MGNKGEHTHHSWVHHYCTAYLWVDLTNYAREVTQQDYQNLLHKNNSGHPWLSAWLRPPPFSPSPSHMLCTETWERDSLWWWTAKDDDNGVLSGFTEDSVRTRLPLHHDSLHLAVLLALPYCMSKEKNPHDAGATACTLLLLGFRKARRSFTEPSGCVCLISFGIFPFLPQEPLMPFFLSLFS